MYKLIYLLTYMFLCQ